MPWLNFITLVFVDRVIGSMTALRKDSTNGGVTYFCKNSFIIAKESLNSSVRARKLARLGP